MVAQQALSGKTAWGLTQTAIGRGDFPSNRAPYATELPRPMQSPSGRSPQGAPRGPGEAQGIGRPMLGRRRRLCTPGWLGPRQSGWPTPPRARPLFQEDRCVKSSAAPLAAAMARHEIELPDDQIERLALYCRALWDWNTKLNLTRHTDYEKFVGRDLVDSLLFARQLAECEKVLDVGTGGGVPGVVLAILRPDLDVSVCDSVGKKARAVADIVAQLDLCVPVYAQNVQLVLEQWRGDTLVARAVARLQKILTWLKPHWGSFHRLLVLKGPAWVAERGEARHRGSLKGMCLRKLATSPLAGTESESVLLQITRGPE